MAADYLRIIIEPTAGHEHHTPFSFDLVVDGDHAVGRYPIFGFQGNFQRRDEHFYPLLLDRDGKIDFGRGYDRAPDERFAYTNLLNGLIEQDRIVEVKWTDGTVAPFRITQIIRMLRV